MVVHRHVVPLALVAAAASLALTACGGGSGSDGASATPSGTSSGAPSATGTVPVGQNGGAKGGPSAGAKPGSSTGTPAGGGRNASNDAYAYKHLCAANQLSVTAKELDSDPDQYVIAVTNRGQAACGISSYYPLVALSPKNAADRSKSTHPLVPSGLGGAPAVPVYAGHTVYAVLDTDPDGAKGGNGGIDEIGVLVDQRFPNAEIHSFPMDEGATVTKHPKLGLYRDTIRDAVTSMRTADINSS
ncbi:hypothetical protein ACFYOD_18565 [Streptomyces sp. NPDC006703]|uniref:hypothetical protein n=1 Tax=Streptomyces sp. NPDC006703 TaxID=3364759 RepID=UPI00368A6105